jgi:hypothetical protein
LTVADAAGKLGALVQERVAAIKDRLPPKA